MHQSGWLRRAVLLALVTASLPLCAQGPPPAKDATTSDAASLLAEIRRRMPLDADLQSGYVCIQRETEVRLDGDGHPTSKTTREYEMYPAVGGSPPFKRLITRDGIPVPAAELAESDRRRQSDRVESAGDREKRLRREADERRERQALVDEVFRLFDFRIAGHEVLAGRPALVINFTPRAGLTASGRTASVAQKFEGRAWVDEQDLQVVRVEARSTDDVNYGLGMFARIYKGTSVFWERRKVEGDAWVPARLEIRASARVLLFRRLGLYRITDYLNYRRLSSPGSPGNQR